MNFKTFLFSNIIVVLLYLPFSCQPKIGMTPSLKTGVNQDESIKSGGDTTVFDVSKRAFSFSANNLNGEQQVIFQSGDHLFDRQWEEGHNPSFAKTDGLGPTFNARKCSECHARDGRGLPERNGQLNNSLLFRLSILGTDLKGGPKPDNNYGGQLNHLSISGVTNEGVMSRTITISNGTYPDGKSYSLEIPAYSLNGNYGSTASLLISPRVAPQMIGMGLLEAISEASIMANADPDDLNRDGISGKANRVWDYVNNKVNLGRFGWKANQPNITQQVAGAFLGDMGITSSLFSDENIPSGQSNLLSLSNGGEPEISDDQLERVIFYASTLAVPARRNVYDSQVRQGDQLFDQINCSACHVRSFTTGGHNIAALEKQKIFPYTDLLLHDMGEGLADNRSDYQADGKEWRTPPLWGIGLFKIVNNHTRYLHDGRARNLEEAILWHDGEARSSKEAFMNLKESEREALIAFLNSL